MKQKINLPYKKLLSSVLLSVALIVFMLFIDFNNEKNTKLDKRELEKAKVEFVIDGDTIIARLESDNYKKKRKIRFIGVDTPEKNQRGYNKAKIFVKKKINNKYIYLEKDTTDKDKYSRLLRYIWLKKNSRDIKKDCLNSILIQKNLARFLWIEPNTKYKKFFK